MTDHERRLIELEISRLETSIKGDQGILAELEERKFISDEEVYERQKSISWGKIEAATREVERLRMQLRE